MNVIRCKNGHFFDGDTYKMCPHCGESVATGVPTTESAKVPAKKKFGWGRKEKTSQNQVQQNPNVYSVTATKSEPNVNIQPNMQQQNISPVSGVSSFNNGEHTLDFWQTTAHSDLTPVFEHNEVGNNSSASVVPPVAEPDYSKNVSTYSITTPTNFNDVSGQNESVGTSSLIDAVQKASANSEGKTMSYFSTINSENVTSTNQNMPVNPVVGWLVCISGKHFGESFNISAGKNSIGRSDDNHIVLFKDLKVSRNKHASITFEPKKKNFYLQPGDSSGLTYLNEDYIDESKKLQSKDIIEIGDSKFMFVPLCDETFTWDDYLPKE